MPRVAGARSAAEGEGIMKRLGVAGAAMVAVGLVLGASVTGASAETQTVHHETETFGDYIPCVSEFPSLEGYEITVTYNGIEHFNENDNSGHFTFTQTGTFSAVPVLFADEDGDGLPDFDEETESFVIAGPREGESFSGKFTIWGGGNFNRSGIVAFTFTFSGHGVGDQGTNLKWNEDDHVTSVGDPFEDPAAIIKVAFERLRCH
jgi:hypothetical protein